MRSVGVLMARGTYEHVLHFFKRECYVNLQNQIFPFNKELR